MAAIDLLAHMGVQAKPAFATLIDLLPLVESDRDSDKLLALRAARARWKITGDSEPALEVAEKSADDEEPWLSIHAADLLSGVDS